MSSTNLFSPSAWLTPQQPELELIYEHEHLLLAHKHSPALAAFITKQASSQTYYTIAYLADRPLLTDAYRAYAYFRWVDDIVDQTQAGQAQRQAFLTRQQAIIARCHQGERPRDLLPEEQLVADLIHNESAKHSGLHTYLSQMMVAMYFDAERQGRLISQKELAAYTHSLARAVTEALHYFIGHDEASPYNKNRYLALTGAHITHMLRDAMEDTAVGYYNISQEFLQAHGITPAHIHHPAYRIWVHNRVQQARRYFAAGKRYLAQVENPRCRLAGYAYIGRFEVILKAIEKDDYWLRAAYPERKSVKNGLKMGLSTLFQTLNTLLPGKQTFTRGAAPFGW